MKNLLLIKTHSFIDVITNSSSELFVCDTNKSIEFVRQALENLLHKYNIGELRNEYNNIGTTYNLTFDQTFGEVFVITEETVDVFIKDFIIDWGFALPEFEAAGIPILQESWDHKRAWEDETEREELFPWNEYREHNEKIRQDSKAAYKTYSDAWLAEHRGVIRSMLLGKIVIESESDNTIPYELWDHINNMFGGTNFHLG